MAFALQRELSYRGLHVTPFEAKRCYAAREFFDPVAVCKRWKDAEDALIKAASPSAVKEVMESSTFEIGVAGVEKSPCLVLRARHQNPAFQCAANLLSTLWACDAAVASQDDGSAKLTVGYDFEGSGIGNFPLATAIPFSRLFVYEYPCLVKDVYLIGMPWMLRPLLPLFAPLLSRRVNLVPVSTTAEFEKAVGYQPVATSGERLAAHVEHVVPRAASMLGTCSESVHTFHESTERQSHISVLSSPLAQLRQCLGRSMFASWPSVHGLSPLLSATCRQADPSHPFELCGM
eukprot:TRINITY_DN41879_c0_g1_i1.p1 TRINITY_DN41879_c0_g1~~TRINITY_DN41879_c0_g1_i1.p1  ORF type:complete len:290 (-),score=10.75 TRINITY_DN41879_c0_g1_i1:206-1075(-)